MIEHIAKTDCTGCKMCGDLCPTGAISFEVDGEGFWYPKVDEGLCSKCSLCVKRCPSLNAVTRDVFEVPAVYSAWSREEWVRLGSTSGGVFREVAGKIIQKGGAVAGCRYTPDWKGAEHALVHDEAGLEPLMVSKYVQSDTEGIYRKTKDAVLSGIPVLFCGTPCQCAAMLSFMGEEHPNLYLQDFICRTINSPLAFRKYVEELEQDAGASVVSLRAKSKETGWESLAYHVEFANGDVYHKDRNEDPFVLGMIGKDLYQRECCYHCKYRTLPRHSADYSLGDFWGIKGQSEDDMFKGITAVLVNTARGSDLLKGAGENLEMAPHTIGEVLPGNTALTTDPVASGRKAEFFSLLETSPFSVAYGKCVRQAGFTRVARAASSAAAKMKRAAGAVCRGDVDPVKYIRYNYFTKAVKRHGRAKIIPSRGAVLSAPPGATIELFGNMRICTNRLGGSRAEARVKVEPGGAWLSAGEVDLMAGSRVEVKRGALLDTGGFSANNGTVIVVAKALKMGEGVMMGRNNIVYDSDFHIIRGKRGRPLNPPAPVVIGDRVWLTSDVTVTKGVTIGSGSMVTAKTVVNRDVPPGVVFGCRQEVGILSDKMVWERTSYPPGGPVVIEGGSDE